MLQSFTAKKTCSIFNMKKIIWFNDSLFYKTHYVNNIKK